MTEVGPGKSTIPPQSSEAKRLERERSSGGYADATHASK